MADLQFSEDCDIAVEQLKEFCRRIHGELHGNGRKGFMEEVKDFMRTFEATETERHRENTERLESISAAVAKKSLLWTVASVIVAIVALMVGALTVYVTVKVSHADLHHLPFTTELPSDYARR